MSNFLRYSAYAIAFLQFIASIVVFVNGYSRIDMLAAFALAILPIVVFLLLRSGPDAEERKLIHAVNKAKLRKELKELEKYADSKK